VKSGFEGMKTRSDRRNRSKKAKRLVIFLKDQIDLISKKKSQGVGIQTDRKNRSRKVRLNTELQRVTVF